MKTQKVTGTILTVNDNNLIAEVEKSISIIEATFKVLNSHLIACDHFKVSLNPNIIKSVLLLEKKMGAIG